MMATLSKLFYNDYKSAKHILILLNEHVPAQMAFWFSLICRIASAQGKNVSVLVTQEGVGWGAQVDTHFPVDMILELDELKQTVKIPFTGSKSAFENLAYEVADNEIAISVVPEDAKLLLDSIKAEETGSNYDMIVGIGVNANHQLIDIISNSKTYSENVNAYMLGTFAVRAAYEKQLQNIKEINVVSEGVSRFMLESIRGFIRGNFDKDTTTNALAFLYNFQFNPNAPEQFNKDVYSSVSSLNISEDIVEKASAAFSLSTSKETEIVNAMIDNMSVYSNGKCKVYQFSKAKFTELGVDVNQVIVSIKSIPMSAQVEDIIVAIQVSDRVTHLFYQGKASTTRRIAQKYGFSMVDNSTIGVIQEVYTAKVLMDTIRIATNEEDPIEDSPVNNKTDEGSVSDNVHSKIDQSEDLEKNYEREEDVIDNSSIDYSEEIQAQDKVEQEPVGAPAEIPTSNGLDFASIAQKMRDSIAN